MRLSRRREHKFTCVRTGVLKPKGRLATSQCIGNEMLMLLEFYAQSEYGKERKEDTSGTISVPQSQNFAISENKS